MNFLSYWKLGIALIASFIAFGAGWSAKGKIDTMQAQKLALQQQQAAMAQQAGVILQERHAITINNKAESDYANTKLFINSLYPDLADSMRSIPKNSGGNLPAIPPAACRVSAAPVSRAYHLTPKQCDAEEAKLIELWNDWLAQALNAE